MSRGILLVFANRHLKTHTERTMTLAESIQAMVANFNPALAKGINAVIQLNATGDGGGSYALSIADGKLEVTEGVADQPTVTINVAAQDWVDIIAGRLDPTKAFMSGKLRIAGDLGLMMRFQRMFMPS
jgi:putative sterol carrier protein